MIVKCQKSSNKYAVRKKKNNKNNNTRTQSTETLLFIYIEWLFYFVELGNDNEEILIFFKLSAWQIERTKRASKEIYIYTRNDSEYNWIILSANLKQPPNATHSRNKFIVNSNNNNNKKSKEKKIIRIENKLLNQVTKKKIYRQNRTS